MTASSRAHSFNAAADQYAASRPSYPPALFDFIEQFTSRPLAGARAPDIGAGPRNPTPRLRVRGAVVLAGVPGG
ncbi:SAM-dependent methyltransferase, partial [Streptomyces mirabilis]